MDSVNINIDNDLDRTNDSAILENPQSVNSVSGRRIQLNLFLDLLPKIESLL